MRHPLYNRILEDLKTDVAQMVEEGHDEAALLAEVDQAAAGGSADALLALQMALWQRPSPAGFGYDEPSDWETISGHFPPADASAPFSGSDEELADKLHAAWQGRCAGCQLGKPLEGTTWPDKMEKVLRAVGSWPLEDFMNPLPEGAAFPELEGCDFFDRRSVKNNWTKGRFDHVAPDDDIHYALTSLITLDHHGADFTAQQVADTVTNMTPRGSMWASGRNLHRITTYGLEPRYGAILGNPCRQSLGAQIRCDPWGWCAPGHPAQAARWAYRDAANSQVRNGIYSGIFFSVLLADVLAHGDVARAVDTAAKYVPPRTRFAEMLEWIRERCDRQADWQAINRAMIEKWMPYAKKFNHSIPNAAITVMGLLKGEGDFTRTLGITVMAGLDTDCTGATAGSIMGCALGTQGIPGHWTAPFNDTIHTNIQGMARLKISDMGRWTFRIARQHARRGGAA